MGTGVLVVTGGSRGIGGYLQIGRRNAVGLFVLIMPAQPRRLPR